MLPKMRPLRAKGRAFARKAAQRGLENSKCKQNGIFIIKREKQKIPPNRRESIRGNFLLLFIMPWQ